MKLLVDMNLAPSLCEALRRHGGDTVHWSTVGDPRATDASIMSWARANGRVVITHDLDFGALLAATHAEGPSVVLVRAEDVLPAALEPALVPLLRKYENELASGALIVLDRQRARVRVLPLHQAE